MKISYFVFKDDIVYEVVNGKLIFIKDKRFDGKKIVDIKHFSTFYIDEKGIKHIKKYDENWQELKCKWDDELIFDKSLKRWRVKTEEEKLNELKQQKINKLKKFAYEYIISKYPLWKQNNDLSDKETIIIKLIAKFGSVITTDDIRKSIYDIMAGYSDVYTELVKYGIKAGYIQTDKNNKPLYTYILKDGTKIIANIDREYRDSDGNLQIIPEDQIIDRNLLFVNGIDINIINEAVELVDKLLVITKRVIWKNAVREKTDELEQIILNVKTIDELEKIDFSVIKLPLSFV